MWNISAPRRFTLSFYEPTNGSFSLGGEPISFPDGVGVVGISCLQGRHRVAVVTPDDGYMVMGLKLYTLEFTKMLWKDVSVPAYGGTSASFDASLLADHSVLATILGLRYDIVLTVGQNGAVSGYDSDDSPVTLPTVETSNRQLDITADDGYQIDTLTVDGVVVAAAAGETTYTYIFASVSEDHAVEVLFTAISGLDDEYTKILLHFEE